MSNSEKDLYTRMIEMAFCAQVPGATAHARLDYLQDLLRRYGLKIVDIGEAPDLKLVKRSL